MINPIIGITVDEGSESTYSKFPWYAIRKNYAESIDKAGGISIFLPQNEKKIPKTELHLHIEGSLEPELMFRLSKRNKIEIPFKSIEEIKSAYNFSNLDSFLKTFPKLK